jgi:hypothetical protein
MSAIVRDEVVRFPVFDKRPPDAFLSPAADETTVFIITGNLDAYVTFRIRRTAIDTVRHHRNILVLAGGFAEVEIVISEITDPADCVTGLVLWDGEVFAGHCEWAGIAPHRRANASNSTPIVASGLIRTSE